MLLILTVYQFLINKYEWRISFQRRTTLTYTHLYHMQHLRSSQGMWPVLFIVS